MRPYRAIAGCSRRTGCGARWSIDKNYFGTGEQKLMRRCPNCGKPATFMRMHYGEQAKPLDAVGE